MKRILVVEDDERMQNALREVLSRKYAIFVASDGFEALEQLKKSHFDVIITDLKMPKMSGLEFFKKAKMHTSSPFIFITAYGTVPVAVEAMREGAFDFILKPFPLELIEETVKRALKYSKQQKTVKKSEGVVQDLQTDVVKEIIFSSPQMQQIVDMADKIATSKATVLIEGESGTGKEVLARYIHAKSKRAGRFVAVNCAAIPETLLESELFGYEKGAFTGAVSSKEGKFELANRGTLLLDEIGDMPLSLQAKLLRVIQEQEVERLGAKASKKIDVRIIATTNRNLSKMVEEGTFREDLYYRLRVIPIKIPPLRERKEDILPLAYYFLKKFAKIYGKGELKLTPEAEEELLNYTWPGNVRELENVIERAVILCDDKRILDKDDLFLEPRKEKRQHRSDDFSVDELERMLIEKVLKEAKGDIKKASLILGIDTDILKIKIERFGIK